MAVVGQAEELWKRGTSFNGGTWKATRKWLVKTDSKADREDTVSGAAGLPAYGAAHPAPIADPMYAEDISYDQLDESPMAWHVTVTYSSQRVLNSNPTADETLVSFSSEIYQEAVFQDVDSKAIVNSAGDYLIDPSPTRDASHLIAKIKTNVASVPTWVISYQNAVNDEGITIGGLPIAKGLAKVQRIEIGDRQKRNNTTFYPVSFEVHIHKDGWRLKPLDAGFRERGGSGVLSQITNNGDSSEPTTPVPLNGSGVALADPTPTTAVFLDFQVYEEKDLRVLPGIS